MSTNKRKRGKEPAPTKKMVKRGHAKGCAAPTGTCTTLPPVLVSAITQYIGCAPTHCVTARSRQMGPMDLMEHLEAALYMCVESRNPESFIPGSYGIPDRDTYSYDTCDWVNLVDPAMLNTDSPAAERVAAMSKVHDALVKLHHFAESNCVKTIHGKRAPPHWTAKTFWETIQFPNTQIKWVISAATNGRVTGSEFDLRSVMHVLVEQDVVVDWLGKKHTGGCSMRQRIAVQASPAFRDGKGFISQNIQSVVFVPGGADDPYGCKGTMGQRHHLPVTRMIRESLLVYGWHRNAMQGSLFPACSGSDAQRLFGACKVLAHNMVTGIISTHKHNLLDTNSYIKKTDHRCAITRKAKSLLLGIDDIKYAAVTAILRGGICQPCQVWNEYPEVREIGVYMDRVRADVISFSANLEAERRAHAVII